MLASLSLYPRSRSDRHRERRIVHRPRHRHEQPFIFYPNINIKPHRTRTHSKLITKLKQLKYYFPFKKRPF